jgi:hypothetical protein
MPGLEVKSASRWVVPTSAAPHGRVDRDAEPPGSAAPSGRAAVLRVAAAALRAAQAPPPERTSS